MSPKNILLILFALMCADFSHAQTNTESPTTDWREKYFPADSFYSGLARVRASSGEYGYVDSSGKEVIPLKYMKASHFDTYNRAIVALKIDGKSGFIDKTGREVTPKNMPNVSPLVKV